VRLEQLLQCSGCLELTPLGILWLCAHLRGREIGVLDRGVADFNVA
jgi:hypothetical protein